VLAAAVPCCPGTNLANHSTLAGMISHIALTHRNSGAGWVIMSTDGRPWEPEIVSHDRRLQSMLDEALSFLASHPGADFTFSTRSANDVQASPYDEHADLLDIERDLARSRWGNRKPHGGPLSSRGEDQGRISLTDARTSR
jgi:hypothetical protein